VDRADIQTSIMAVQFEGGVVIGADSRTTTGSYIVSVCHLDWG
jgi:20S proteasome subunit beta 1